MKNWLTNIYIFCILMVLSAFEIQTLASDDPLFQSEVPLELILEADIIALINDKSDEPEYIPALLIHKMPNLSMNAFEIKVKARGNTRRVTELCDFPPLKFNFKKDHLKNTVFDGQDKLKFVSQCRQEEEFQNYVMEEYLIYKTYNILTEESYKTRLVNITIKDTELRVPEIKFTGFLIEDDKTLAKRIESKSYEELVHFQDSLIDNSLDRLSMFQYMIGNTDWYVTTNHNIDIFQTKINGDLLPVPFDFDFSGVIDASYAIPSKEIPIYQVKKRYFKGPCRDVENLSSTLALFNEKKDEIYTLYDSFEYLPNYAIKKSLRYYNKFYKIINNTESIDDSFLNACNSPGYAGANMN